MLLFKLQNQIQIPLWPVMAKECETFLISHVAMIVGKQVALNPFLEFQVRIDEFNHKFVFEYNLAV